MSEIRVMSHPLSFIHTQIQTLHDEFGSPGLFVLFLPHSVCFRHFLTSFLKATIVLNLRIAFSFNVLHIFSQTDAYTNEININSFRPHSNLIAEWYQSHNTIVYRTLKKQLSLSLSASVLMLCSKQSVHYTNGKTSSHWEYKPDFHLL